MKIQPIKTSFKGLFTNKTNENNGNWRMEYSPYSWEKYTEYYFDSGRAKEVLDGKFSIMSRQESWQLMADDIPDNEREYQITYLPGYYPNKAYECCKDILGTEFYYCDYLKNSMRRTITVVPAMNLEDSLIVKSNKLKVFVEKKQEYKKELVKELQNQEKLLEEHESEFNNYYYDHDEGFLDRTRDKAENAKGMYWSFSHYRDRLSSIKKDYQKIESLRDSIDKINSNIIKMQEDARTLQQARIKGTLIDISRRDINDPNKLLWDALQNIEAAMGKIIALPHRIISVKELISSLNQNIRQSRIPEKAIEAVDHLIKMRL